MMILAPQLFVWRAKGEATVLEEQQARFHALRDTKIMTMTQLRRAWSVPQEIIVLVLVHLRSRAQLVHTTATPILLHRV
jgi:hypothetical protein